MATEQVNIANVTENNKPEFLKTSMPAWVPAVTVATAMIIFLAASFYLRHRKVLKKRQILMDYFHIIFQYGGVRRKRMVAALCNTNSITLRQLGRSFMISFDSIANNDNSCPFFLEDTAFTHHSTYTPHKKTLFRSKGRSGGNKLRPPMRSPSPTMHANHRQHNPTSFQEIRMKFKSRKSPGPSPDSGSRLVPPRLGSLSSIHDDDPAAHILYHDGHHEGDAMHAHERRNAYVLSYDSSESVILEEDFEKPTIPNIVLERLKQHSSCGKRHSEPIYYEGGYDPYSNTHLKVLPDDCPKVYGTRVLYPSTDRVDNKSDNGTLYRNSEPTIMIHSASNDFGSSFELDDLQSQCSNGLVFVKKVTTDDGNVERYYINERPAQSFNQRHRPSLSKVSYVPSGNMNDYYHTCLQSPKRKKTETHQNSQESGSMESKSDEKSKSGWSWKKSGSKKTTEIEVPTLPAGRRGRLSIGDIAVSNFNRRIVDFPSESLGSTYDSDSEIPCNKLSKDQSQNKSASTWTRLKNVFSGSRSSQSSVTKMKQTKSMQGSEDRGKRGGKRVHGKWRRFVGVLTGFGSMSSEPRRSKHSALQNKNSKSLPTGLDNQMCGTDDFNFRRNSHAVSLDSQSVRHMNRSTENQHFFGKIRNRIIPPSTRRTPPKTQSFPDGIMNMEYSFDKTHFVCPFPRSPRRSVVSLRNSGNKVKKKYSSCDSYSRARSYSDVHRHYLNHQTSSQSSCDDPYFKQYQNLSAVSSPRSKSPVFTIPNDIDGISYISRNKRSRSHSPLPEGCFKAGSRRKSSHFFSCSERRSLSEREKCAFPYFANSVDCASPLTLISNHLCNECIRGNVNKNVTCHDSSDKYVNKNRQFSTGHLDHIEKSSNTLGVNHLHTDHVSLKHRHSISGPTCNGFTVKDQKSNSHNSGLDTGKSSLTCKQTLTLDVDTKLFGSSVESVYFDTVSVLGSPSSSLKQTTAPNTPLNQTDHCVLEMPTTEKEISSTNSCVINTQPSVLLSSQSSETKLLNGSGGKLVECQVTLVAPVHTPADDIVSQTITHSGELSLLKEKGDNDSLPVSSVPLHSKPFTPSNTSSTLSRAPNVSLDLQLSPMTCPSLEHQISLSSSINKDNEIKHKGDEHQKPLDQRLEADENNKASPPLRGYRSPQLPSPLDLESNIPSSKTTVKGMPLNFPTQGGTTFQLVSETNQKSSPEEVAIFNLTRLPRFGRRQSQCTPSPLSEGRPGSCANTPIQLNATMMSGRKDSAP